MTFKISEDCISCGACEADCPNNAIGEGDSIYKIDPDRCSECVGSFNKPQCADICPVGAPNKDLSIPESHEQLLKKWQKIHPNTTPKV